MRLPTLRGFVRAVGAAWREIMPDPLDVLAHDLGLPRLHRGDIDELARAWCARYRRRFMRQLAVHDAVHFLLDAAPTPLGEQLVTAFQVRHQLYDRGAIDVAIVCAGVMVHRYGGEQVRGELAARRRGITERFDAFRQGAATIDRVGDGDEPERGAARRVVLRRRRPELT